MKKAILTALLLSPFALSKGAFADDPTPPVPQTYQITPGQPRLVQPVPDSLPIAPAPRQNLNLGLRLNLPRANTTACTFDGQITMVDNVARTYSIATKALIDGEGLQSILIPLPAVFGDPSLPSHTVSITLNINGYGPEDGTYVFTLRSDASNMLTTGIPARPMAPPVPPVLP